MTVILVQESPKDSLLCQVHRTLKTAAKEVLAYGQYTNQNILSHGRMCVRYLWAEIFRAYQGQLVNFIPPTWETEAYSSPRGMSR